jgi:hypothetical protein
VHAAFSRLFLSLFDRVSLPLSTPNFEPAETEPFFPSPAEASPTWAAAYRMLKSSGSAQAAASAAVQQARTRQSFRSRVMFFLF